MQMDKLPLNSVSTKYPDLTIRMEMVLDWIVDFIVTNTTPPTYREICAGFGLRSLNSATQYIIHLIDAGYLSVMPGRSRAIVVNMRKLRGPFVRTVNRTICVGLVPKNMSIEEAIELSEAINAAVAKLTGGATHSANGTSAAPPEKAAAIPPASRTSERTCEQPVVPAAYLPQPGE